MTEPVCYDCASGPCRCSQAAAGHLASAVLCLALLAAWCVAACEGEAPPAGARRGVTTVERIR